MIRVAAGVRWWSVIGAVALVAASSAIAGQSVGSSLLPVVQTLGYGAIGAFLVGRVRQNPIGWLLLWFGLNFSLGYSADQTARWALAQGHREIAAWLSWFESWSFLAGLPLIVTLLPLWFPDGRLPSPRFRWVGRVAVAGVVLAVLGQALRPGAAILGLPNPLGAPVPGVIGHASFAAGVAMIVLAAAGAILALVRRFRRSRGLERQQLKWLLAAVAVAAVVFATLAPWAMTAGTRTATDLALGGIVAGNLAVPIGVAIAILRFRLYDIDRIVSRTVGWGLVTTVLVGIYVAGVFVLRDLLPLEGDLAVAASTLAVAAMFDPLRRRIQGGVDRRFNRAHFDARRTVDAFGDRLRNRVDLLSLGTELSAIAAKTMEPVRLSLWIRSNP